MLTLTMFSVITRCLGFLYKIYLTRIMTTTELGIYSLTLSIYMVLITIVSSSIPLTISKITAKNKMNKSEFNTNYSVTSSLVLTTAISILLCILILISKPLITLIIGDGLGYEILLYLLPSIIFSAVYSQIKGYLWGIENYFSVSMVEFIEQVIRIGFCILFISCNIIKSPTIAVGVSLSIACGLSTLYGIILYIKQGGKFRFKKGYYKDIIKSSLPLTCVRIFGSLLLPLIAFIIPLRLTHFGMTKDLALSELGILMGMTLPILSIPATIIGALCMILIPRINSNKDNEKRNKEINHYFELTISLIFIFVPIFISIGNPICTLLFGNSISGEYLKLCSWIIVPMGISQISTSILNALNQESKNFLYFVISSIIMVILSILLPKYTGIMSMLIATGISSIVLSILNIIKITKITNYKLDIFKLIILHSITIIPIIIFNNFTYNLLERFSLPLISIIATSLISISTYIILCITFGLTKINVIKNYILTKKHSY